MIYTHVLQRGAFGVRSPADGALGGPQAGGNRGWRSVSRHASAMQSSRRGGSALPPPSQRSSLSGDQTNGP